MVRAKIRPRLLQLSGLGEIQMSEVVQLKIENEKAFLSIARPEALNALNDEVMSGLEKALEQIEGKPSLRLVILQGLGEKAFVAGADIKEIHALTKESAGTFARRGQSVFRRIERLPCPVLAQVQGFALGGGFELAMSADLIVASEKAKFGLPECSLGLIPGFGGTVRLAQRVGPSRAKEMALLGDFYTAKQGYEMGFVNRVVAPEELNKVCLEIAQTLSERAPLALKAIKASVDLGRHLSSEEAFELEARLFQELFLTEDQKEGTLAFIEKRKPQFKGK